MCIPRLLRAIFLLWAAQGIAAPAVNPDMPSDALADGLFNPAEVVSSVAISPGGNRLAILQKNRDESQVLVRRVGTQKNYSVFSDKDIKSEKKMIIALDWVDDDILAIVIRELRKGVAELADTRVTQQLLFAVLQDGGDGNITSSLRGLRTSGWMVSPLPKEKDMFLFARSRSVSNVYKISVRRLSEFGKPLGKTEPIDGGQFGVANQVAAIEHFVYRWLADTDGAVLAAIAEDEKGAMALWTRASMFEQWKISKTWQEDDEKDEGEDSKAKSKKETKKSARKEDGDESGEAHEKQPKIIYWPLALTDKPEVLYSTKFVDDDAAGLYKYDYANDQEELIYSMPDSGIMYTLESPHKNGLLGVSIIENGNLKQVYFSESYQGVVNELKSRIDGLTLSVAGVDLAENRYLLYSQDSTHVPVYYLYDRPGKQLTSLVEEFSLPAKFAAGQVMRGSVTSDNFNIEYILTLPAAHAGPAPLIVMPHGGPIGIMDYVGFNPATHYFANSGYAVLQVNYRGSAGYSKEFEEAGKKQWGEKILEDIEVALAKVRDRKDIAASHVCIIGGSYGGYAALMLPIRHPDWYRCTASFAGVTDLNLFVSAPDKTSYVRKFFSESIGDSKQDYDALRAISPLYLADKLQLPVYLAHGGDDYIVDVEHSIRMKRLLDLLGKPNVWKFYPDQGHGFDDGKLTAQHYHALLEFVRSNI